MKAFLAFTVVLFIGCENKAHQPDDVDSVSHESNVNSLNVPDIVAAYDSLVLHREKGVWTLNDEPYSGFALKFFDDGSVHKKMGFHNGKKQGKAWEYFPDGHLRQITHYHQNRVHGKVRNWSGSQGHPTIALRHYHMGKPHGEHKKWYKSGQLFKVMHYNMGKEEGMQQAFNENGSIYANYEARDGRSFGLKRAMLCFGLDDEDITLSDGE